MTAKMPATEATGQATTSQQEVVMGSVYFVYFNNSTRKNWLPTAY